LNVFELFGTIAIDHSEAERSLDKTVGSARDAESALEKTFKRIGTYVAAAFSVKAIVDFGKACSNVFASVAAEESAFAQIMGDYADTAQKKLNAVADQTGITSTRMTGAMTSLTAKFKGLGYNVEDATTLASDGLLIAADAAAFWDMSLDESMSHLNSFINGSYEGGEAIGLFANDTQMAAYAVEKGIVADAKAWAKLDEATKQATRLDYAKAMQQQSGAAGQAAKESESYANVMANLQASWRQFQSIVGKPILEKLVLPAMRKLNEFMPVLTESVTKGIEWLSEGFDKIASYFSDVFTEDGLKLEALPNALKNMFRDVVRKIPGLLSSVGQSIKNAWTNIVWPAVQGTMKMFFGVDLPGWDKIESAVLKWWNGENGISAQIAKVCNWTLNLFGKPADVTKEDVEKAFDGWWEKTKEVVSGVCDWVLKIFTAPAEAAADVEKVVKDWWDTVKSGAYKALEWTLTLFGVPKAKADGVRNLVSGWWQGVKEKAQAALIWTLQLFQNPKETKKQIENKIKEWWSTACTWVADACNWVLNLFGAPAEVTEKQVSDTLSTWWKNTKEFVKGACDWVLGLFSAPDDTDEDTVSSVLSTWWTKTKALVTNACNWVLGIFGVPGVPAEGGIRAILGTWWNAVKANIAKVCAWTLGLFGVPQEETAVDTITKWWSGVEKTIKDTLGIDLSGINIGGIFTAAGEAATGFIESCKTFYTDVKNAIAVDETGKLDLGTTLSALFDAGVSAAANLVTVAAGLVGEIVGAITGKEEDAKKVSAFFSDLFGWAGEIAIGVKDGAISLLTWLRNNGFGLAEVLGAIAGAAAGFALSNPVITGLAAIGAFIAIMSTDWGSFEKNHPQLVDMLTELTGMNFENVASSMTNLKSGLEELITYIGNNKDLINIALILIGGAVFKAHPFAGMSIMALGGINFVKDGMENGVEEVPSMNKKETLFNLTNASPELRNAVETGDYSNVNPDELTAYGTVSAMSGAAASILNFGKKFMNNPLAEDAYDAMLATLEENAQATANGEDIPYKTIFGGLLETHNKFYQEHEELKPPGWEYAYDSGNAILDFFGRIYEANMEYLDDGKVPDDWWSYYFPDGGSGSQGGGVLDFDTKHYMDSPPNPGGKYGGSLLQTLTTQMALNKEEMLAALREGVSGITITATVDTGNITLDTGTLAGAIAPKINFVLGSLNDRSSRG
jgi:predicted NUDIX family NTP pyrophosphohydrolase